MSEIIKIMDIDKIKKINKEYLNKINLEKDEETILDLKDECYEKYWQIFYKTLEDLDVESEKINKTKKDEILGYYLQQLPGPPFTSHEQSKILLRALTDFTEQSMICQNDKLINFPNIIFYVNKDGERKYRITYE